MDRLRTTGALSLNTLSVRVTEFPGNGGTCGTSATTGAPITFGNVGLGEKKVMYDVVTPSYFAKRKAGVYVFNPMNSVVYKHRAIGSSSTRFTQKTTICSPPVNYWYEVNGQFFCYKLGGSVTPTNTTLLSGPEIPSLADEVWTKCLAQVEKGKANYIESLAESAKAFTMLARPLENVHALIRNLRRSGRRAKGYEKVSAQSRDYILFLSSEWLRFRYGLSPIISDVKAALKALETSFNVPSQVYKSRASGVLNLSGASTGVISEAPNATLTYRKYTQDNVSCRGVSFDRYRRTPFNELGLTFQNAVGVVWELTHYSFVLDWFANIGDLIYANIPRVGVEHIGGTTTTRQYTSTSYTPVSYVELPGSAWTLSGGLSDYLLLEEWRTVRTVRRDNGRLVINSDFRLDEWVRASDAAALTIQLLNSIGFKFR